MADVPTFAPKSDPKVFKTALNRLGSDAAFRASVTKNPTVLTKEYHLSIQELHALRTAAQLSGVDMAQVNVARAAGIAQFTRSPSAIDINVSCCCCCCCGETAVLRYG